MFSIIMVVLTITIAIGAGKCPMNLTLAFLAMMAFIHIIAGILHLDIVSLACGTVYWMLIPSFFIFLYIFMLANLNVTSWGTREGGAKAKVQPNKDTMGMVKEWIDSIKNLWTRTEPTGPTAAAVPVSSPENPDSKGEEMEESQELTPVVETTPEMDEPELDEVEYLDSDFSKDEFNQFTIFGGDTIRDLQILPQTKIIAKKMAKRADQRTGQPWGGKKRLDDTDELIYKWLPNDILSGHTGTATEKMRMYEREWTDDCPNKDFYLSWILDEESKLSAENRVYSLPENEYKFWEQMKNLDDGYIKVLKNAKDKSIGQNEKKIVTELTESRDRICKMAMLINILYLVLAIVLKVKADELPKIQMHIPMQILSWGTSSNFTEWQMEHMECGGKLKCNVTDYNEALQKDQEKVSLTPRLSLRNFREEKVITGCNDLGDLILKFYCGFYGIILNLLNNFVSARLQIKIGLKELCRDIKESVLNKVIVNFG